MLCLYHLDNHNVERDNTATIEDLLPVRFLPLYCRFLSTEKWFRHRSERKKSYRMFRIDLDSLNNCLVTNQLFESMKKRKRSSCEEQGNGELTLSLDA